jgi:Beta-propeller repeat
MGQMMLGFCAASVLTMVLPSAIAEGRGAIVANSQLASPTGVVTGYGNLPIRFEPNVGQASARMEYVARGSGYTVGIGEQGVALSLRSALLRLRPVHAGARPQLRAERQQTSVSNYFIGNDRSKWHHNVANYAAVRYKRIYPGIDWVLYGNPRQLEYDFVVAPRADPGRIELGISGADSLTLADNGDLMVNMQGVTLRQLKPIVYQTAADGSRHQIDGRYVLTHQHVTFALGDYDHTRELIIDPTFVYSTYLGGDGFDRSTAIAADSEGNAYVVGSTSSTDFPTEQPLQGSNLEHNFSTAFIAKFNAAGTALIYSTYLGGSGSDRTGNLGFCGPASSDNFGRGALIPGNGGDGATAIAVDAAGNAYVAGFTSSSDFPTVDPLQATNHAAVNHGSNAFLAKLNAAGNALVYSTYLGGSGAAGALITGDSAAAIAVDGAGAAYVTGITMSADFPTLMPFQATNEEPAGNPTAFVAKFNAAGNALVYSSYLGGSGGNSGAAVGDCANAIAADGNGNAYVAGQTSSTNFPTAVAFQSVNRSLGSPNRGTAFVTKLNSSGSALIYSTYLGGSAGDAALAVAADASGDAYVSGYTWSSDFPTSNALQPQNATGGHGANAFVTKLNAAGSELIYSTYLGGSTDEQANAIALDGTGNAYVVGSTYSNDFPVVDPLQTMNLAASNNGNNAFISVLSPTGSTLEFSTYLGGSGSEVFHSCPVGVVPCGTLYDGDSAIAVAVDNSGNAYVTGITNSSDFPTVMAFQTRPAYTFVTKVAVGPRAAPASIDEARPSTTNGGSGAMGWNAIGILGLAVAARRRKPRERSSHCP